MEKVIVRYDHDPSDLTQMWMAFSTGVPQDSDWVPAFRDTINGQRVLWVKVANPPSGNVWVKGREGAQRAVAE